MMIWRFRRLIRAYGGDPLRWPDDRRRAAQALLERSDRARVLLAEARRLDAALSADKLPSADERLASLIVARATALPQERPQTATGGSGLGWSLPRLWPQAVGLAAAAVLGVVVGWTDLLPPGIGGGDEVDLTDFFDAGGDDDGAIL